MTRAISVTGGYPLEGYNPDIVVPKGAQLGDGPVEAAQDHAAATGKRRGLDQGLHDAPFLGG